MGCLVMGIIAVICFLINPLLGIFVVLLMIVGTLLAKNQ